jgi:hypothetical protein
LVWLSFSWQKGRIGRRIKARIYIYLENVIVMGGMSDSKGKEEEGSGRGSWRGNGRKRTERGRFKGREMGSRRAKRENGKGSGRGSRGGSWMGREKERRKGMGIDRALARVKKKIIEKR